MMNISSPFLIEFSKNIVHTAARSVELVKSCFLNSSRFMQNSRAIAQSNKEALRKIAIAACWLARLLIVFLNSHWKPVTIRLSVATTSTE